MVVTPHLLVGRTDVRAASVCWVHHAPVVFRGGELWLDNLDCPIDGGRRVRLSRYLVLMGTDLMSGLESWVRGVQCRGVPDISRYD